MSMLLRPPAGALDALRDRLVAALAGTTLPLTDALLGVDLLTPLGLDAVDVRDASVAFTAEGTLRVEGAATVLGAAVAVALTVDEGDDGRETALHLAVEADTPWGPPALGLHGVQIDLRLAGAGTRRRLDGVIVGATTAGDIGFAVTVPAGVRGTWELAARLEGDLVGLLPTMAGDALAELVGADRPVAALDAVHDVSVRATVDVTTHVLHAIEVELTVPSWSPAPSFALRDASFRLGIDEPASAADRRVALAATATIGLGDVTAPVALTRAADGRWTIGLGDDALVGLDLVDLLRAVGGEDALAAVPSDLVALAGVRLVTVRVVVDPTASVAARRLAEVAVLLRAEWELAEGGLRLADGSLACTLHEPLSSATRSFDAELGGTVVLGGIAFEVGATRQPATADHPAGWALRGLLTPDTPLLLDTALGGLAGATVTLPPELPAIALEALALEADTATGAFTLTGRATAGWSLPLGDGFTAASVDVRVERGERVDVATPGPLAIELTVRTDGRADVADGFVATAATLAFTSDGAAGTWAVHGSLDAELFDHPVAFAVHVDDDGTTRRFVLSETGTGDGDPVTVDLAGAGTLTVRRVEVEIDRTRPSAGPDPTTGPATDPGLAPTPTTPTTATTAWRLTADGALDLLDGTVTVDGTLTLAGRPGSLELALEPADDGDAARVDVVLPGTEGVGLHLALGPLRIRRTVAAPGLPASWTVHAEPSLWCSGLPGDLARVLPSTADGALRAVLAVDGGDATTPASVTVDVTHPVPRQDLALPSFTLLDDTVDLGTAAFAIDAIGVRWTRGGGLGVDATFAVGLPSRLNDVLAGGHHLLTTFDPESGDGMVAARLTATLAAGAPSLEITPLDSPLAAVAFDPVDPLTPTARRRATADLGACGRLTFDVPTFAMQGDVVRVTGGFEQHGLALPLAPVAWLLRALDLGRLADLLPRRLPLRDLPIVSALRDRDIAPLVALLTDADLLPAGASLPVGGELADALAPLVDALDELPERLVPYLDLHVPERLAFDLSFSLTGAVRGTVLVADGDGVTGRGVEPLRLVLPGLGPTGPVLTGVSLWSLSIGEVLGGAAVVANVDADVEQFDLLPVALRVALPAALRAGLPSTRTLGRRVVADRLTIVAVPAALVALPVFFEDLAVEHHGIEGVELAAHLRAPHPTLDVRGALQLFHAVKAFVTDPDARLDEASLHATGLDLRLVAGPAYLQLPEHLGGRLLGSRTATSEASALSTLVSLLNGLKGLRIDDLLAAVPDELRHGTLPDDPRPGIGPIGIAGAWRVAAPGDGRRGIDVEVSGAALVGPVPVAHGALTVRARGASDVAVELEAGGGTPSVVGIELQAALDTAGLAPRRGGALALTDPAARVVADGPAGRHDAFTIEWWMCPTAFADYDQFVATDAAWGAFVFHATATGAVYCGTDVATRLTPAQLPTGTLRAGEWQHIAVTYDGDRLTVLRDGAPVATRTGVSRPRAWTGLRLGMPQVGTQVTGGIAEIRVWDGVRPAAAIEADRHHRLSGGEPGLLAYWPCDDAGTELRDASGHGCTARVTAGGRDTTAVLPPLTLGAAAPRPHAAGAATLSVFGRTMAQGVIDIDRDRAVLGARVDLFGDDSTFRVRGRVDGEIGRDRFTLDGSVEVGLAGMTLADARAHVTPDRVELHGRWLNVLTTDLTMDGRFGRRVFTGRVTGSVPATITFPTQYVPTANGPAKLCDGFTVRTAFELDLAVQAGEAMGFSASGTASFSAGTLRRTLNVQWNVAPTSLVALTSTLTNLVLPRARELFQSLYPTAELWVRGAASGAFAWTGTAWNDTAAALKWWFGRTSAEAVTVLDGAAYDAADIGRVLSTLFTTEPLAMARAFRDSGADVMKAARATFTIFEEPFRRDPFTQANSVTAMLRTTYGAAAVGGTITQLFPISASDGVQILTQQRYALDEVAGVARNVWGLSVQDTSAALRRTGASADAALRAVQAAFPELGARAVADILVGVGYAKSTLDDVLHHFGLPGL